MKSASLRYSKHLVDFVLQCILLGYRFPGLQTRLTKLDLSKLPVKILIM